MIGAFGPHRVRRARRTVRETIRGGGRRRPDALVEICRWRAISPDAATARRGGRRRRKVGDILHEDSGKEQQLIVA